MPDSSDILRAARPVVRLANQDRAELGLGLLELTVSEDTAGLYRCEATFGNWGTTNGTTSFLYFDRKVLEFGKDLSIKFDDATLFEGRVIGIEGDFPEGRPARITVLADDRLQDLRMTRRTRSWENSNDADVLHSIASDHGLDADIDLDGPTRPVIAQVNQSDLRFARERTCAAGGELWVEGTKFIVKRRPARASTDAPELAHGRNLRSFKVLADLAHQRTKVSVSGWDIGAKDAVKHDASASLIGSELDGGDSGPSILQNALGERVDTLVHTAARSSAEAEAIADAHFRDVARRFVVGHGTAEGDVRLRVGRKVQISGVGALFAGKYVICETRHTFTGTEGYRTDFTVERPALGKP